MNRLPRLVAAAAALACTATVSLAQPATARAHPVKPPFPQIELAERKSQGQRAIELLGDRLPEVARWYGKAPAELRNMLQKDHRLKVDQRGRLFYEEELEAPLPAFTERRRIRQAVSAESTLPGGAPMTLLDGTLLPLDQTFRLHSKPGAKRTIYLDFDGATLTNTAWGPNATLTAQPFDLDGIPGSFNTTELQRIQYIWQRVAEDFAPFDVNVTTEVPAAGALTRSGSTDDTFGTTVLITHRNGVYSCSCGGVAYLGVFDDTSEYYKPALVFFDALGSGNEKYVAEAISHEAGHNLGLSHDGWSGGGYYEGHGSGTTGWAPIMGVGYSRNLVQWSKGEYATATTTQDDFVVAASNGLPLRADDHGNTTGAATPMAGATSGGLTQLSATGVIESAPDVDVFSFAAGAGSATFTIAPAARSANLDPLIELRDTAGTLLASANPATALGTSMSVTLPAAGTYFLSVQGVGKPAIDTDPGYSDYGSLGQYLLTGSVPAAGAQPPVASFTTSTTRGTAPLAVNFDGRASSDVDGSIVAWNWGFGPAGATGSGPTASYTYTTPGTYSAELTVTDDSGMTAVRSTTITVDAPVVLVPMRVGAIDMSLSVAKNGNARATAVVNVLDGNGRVVPNATVTGSWSGIVSGSASAVTNTSGRASFSSPQTRNRGTFTFTVTGVSLSGYSYNQSLNTETSDSITR